MVARLKGTIGIADGGDGFLNSLGRQVHQSGLGNQTGDRQLGLFLLGAAHRLAINIGRLGTIHHGNETTNAS